MKVISPVTYNDNVKFVKNIKASLIIELYKQSLNIDIGKYLSDCTDISLYKCLESGIEFFSPQKIAGDGIFYKELEKIDWYYQDYRWEYTEVKNLIKKTDRILEVGCGKGSFLKSISKICEEAVGLELNDNAVSYGASQGIKIYNEPVQHHAIKYPEYYDVVCAFQVLEHIEDVKSFIQGCLASLKKKGLLVFAVPNNNALFFKEQRLLPLTNLYYTNQQHTLALNSPPHHMCRWSKKSLFKIAPFFNMKTESIIHEPLGTGRKLLNDNIIKSVKIAGVPYKDIVYRLLKKVRLINTVFPGYRFGDSLLAVYRRS